MRMIPDWLITGVWFAAGLLGTGALWYFLGQKRPIPALWAAFGTVAFALLAVTLQIHHGLLLKQTRESTDSTAAMAPPTAPASYQPQSVSVTGPQTAPVLQAGRDIVMINPPPEPTRTRPVKRPSTPMPSRATDPTPPSPITIQGDVHGPVIVSQGQQGGQVAHTINNYGPPKRSLAADIRAQMLTVLRSAQPSTIGFASTQGDMEAHEFKRLLMTLFVEAGWTVSDLQTFMFFGEQKGIVLTIPFGAPEDGPVQVVAKALQLTGGPVQGNRGDMAKECGIYVQVWHAP